MIIIFIYFFSINNIFYLFIFGTIIYVIIFIEITKYLKKYIYFIILYFLLSFISYIFYLSYYYDYNLFNILILTIISFDTFSFFSGIFFGKTHPFKKVSPKKTIEGYLGGLIFTNLILITYISYFINFSLNYIFFINLIILSSIFGDLIQSFFKRINTVKHSSNFLPGHGGFFDRFDSFMTSIILILFYSYLFK
tara:strand:+ start:66 stop:647 length:582 start_codon:yes stop_codon:yes gene_type:complete